jgi:hypothetical protein
MSSETISRAAVLLQYYTAMAELAEEDKKRAAKKAQAAACEEGLLMEGLRASVAAAQPAA